MMERRAAIDLFYEILGNNIARRGCYQLRILSSSGPLYSNPELNRPGVYFIFEPTEFREDGFTPRVVYVGMTKTERLFTRLEQHSRDKDHSNLAWYVSDALSIKQGKTAFSEHLSAYWSEVPDELYREMRAFELESVLPQLGSMSFTWLPVSERAMRDRLERGAIALLSNLLCAERSSALDAASSAWLGSQLTAPSTKSGLLCANSGLWNRDHIDEQGLETSWLDEFEVLVAEPASRPA
jgi:hypothetical protein